MMMMMIVRDAVEVVNEIVPENKDERPDRDLVAQEFDIGLGLTWSH